MTSDKQERKEHPIASGVLDYFPDAIAAVAHVSYVGNQQHNPGEEMHWDRSKSKDQADCIARHLLERGTLDTDGLRHSAKVAWRALALLQEELEQVEKNKPLLAALDVQVCANPAESKEIRPVYLSGPMRGYPGLNFAAFDAAAARGRALGFAVISPAEEDRLMGIDPDHFKGTPEMTREFARRDVNLIFKCGAVAVLRGWSESTGAVAEVHLAKWLGLPILHADDFKPLWERNLV